MPPDGSRGRAARQAAELIGAALAADRTFEAVDLARAALAEPDLTATPARHELAWLAATALLRSGATGEAKAEVAALEAAPRRPVKGSLGALRARLLEELWQATRDPADLERALRVALARANDGFAQLASAALLAQARGDHGRARRLATRALSGADVGGRAIGVERLFDEARIALVLDDQLAAGRAFQRLATLIDAQPLERARLRRALAGLATYGIEPPAAALEAFREPGLVIYCGARDPTLAGLPRVVAAIQGALDAVGAEIAYGAAAAGADLLFAEAVLARGGELNLVLPASVETFRARLVVPAGEPWPGLFDRVLARAASVTSVADDRQVVDALLLQFGNRVIDGTARLRAERLATRPVLLAALDPLAESGPGGAADFIDHWGDPARLRLIDLEELGATAVAEPVPPAAVDGAGQRVAGLLFADVVGFSRLDDALLPRFWRFMAAVGAHMRAGQQPPRMLTSWGDAIFVVAATALATADYAMALKAAFAAVDSREFGLPEAMQMRVGLHAGPVFEGRHPLTGETMVYGGNVNRAARIEPITVPGRVYASAPFVAWLRAEESAAEAETRLEGGRYRPRYRCTYRGIVELAKRYGAQAVYEVEPWRQETPMPEARIEARRFAMTLTNDLAEHRRLAAALERFLEPFGHDGPSLAPFEIAFDEVMTNICRYAWTDAGEHAIEVEAVLDGDRLVVTFTDDGRPFDPLAAAAPDLDEDIAERAMGGLGIHLVRELMDEVRYERAEDRNRLTLTRRLEPAAETTTEPPTSEPPATGTAAREHEDRK